MWDERLDCPEENEVGINASKCQFNFLFKASWVVYYQENSVKKGVQIAYYLDQ